MTEQYYDLEINILSCLILKPELMKEITLSDCHFVKHQRLWQFMKSFYSKFETFDIPLMFSICKDKYQIAKYCEWLVDVDCNVALFHKYEDRIKELFAQKKQDKWIIDKIFKVANDLYVGNINLEKFKDRINKIEEEAKMIFEGDDK